MSYKLREELANENLCTHFVLPLLKLSRSNFISSNFVESYLSTDRQYILVSVYDENLIYLPRIEAHPCFTGRLIAKENSSTSLLSFRIPERWKSDVNLFCEGRFSEMSDTAKDTIRTYSGLNVEAKLKSGAIVTDGRLLALEKHTVLREMWKETFYGKSVGLKEDKASASVFDDMELLSVPGPQSYMDITEMEKAEL